MKITHSYLETHFICIFLLCTATCGVAAGESRVGERKTTTLKSKPNRPSPGVEWLETEKDLSREQRRDLWLQLFDHNGNGKLDPEEIEEMARYRYAQREREATANRLQKARDRKEQMMREKSETEKKTNGETQNNEIPGTRNEKGE